MSARVRIRCRPPTPAGRFCEVLPDISDCEVDVVDADGRAHPLRGVHAIQFYVQAEGGEPASAVLALNDVELDVELPASMVLVAAAAETRERAELARWEGEGGAPR